MHPTVHPFFVGTMFVWDRQRMINKIKNEGNILYFNRYMLSLPSMRKYALALLCLLLLTSCSRSMLRQIIDRLGRPDKEKPEVYHAFEGYSPGAKKSKVEEDFSRYHYYIAPIREETYDSDPDIYFRQDYEAIEPVSTFDEEQYWREHPLTFDEPSPSSDNPDTP